MSDWCAEARARCERATKGPWVHRSSVNAGGAIYAPDGRCVMLGAFQESPVEQQANIDFAAHARTDLPRALALVEGLAKVLEEYGQHYSICPINDGYGDACGCGFDAAKAALAAAHPEGGSMMAGIDWPLFGVCLAASAIVVVLCLVTLEVLLTIGIAITSPLWLQAHPEGE